MATVEPPNPLPPDDNVGPALLGVSGTCLALVIITTSIRIWVRSALRSLGPDDYTIVTVTILGIARFGVQVAQVAIGNGRHRWYIDPEDYVRNNMLGWVAQLLLFASICLLKISILLLLLRIKDSRKVKLAAWGIMAGLVITNFGCIIILLAECKPTSAYWTGVGECWDPRVRIYYIYATIGSFTLLFVTRLCHLERQATNEDQAFRLGFDEFGACMSMLLLQSGPTSNSTSVLSAPTSHSEDRYTDTSSKSLAILKSVPRMVMDTGRG
ncbi:hypothetical protein NW766_010503 [Fusarium irregulare]|uniref:Rhodopsin domain-containing protein n=1 Tax=Fusarium irregulare TaxID=2494466 RepID=A0A9W8PH05_9HYPO|nr:hypothetical protein NW766_010503 [Fusarium irregulare]